MPDESAGDRWRVFLSSTFLELKEYRRAVRERCAREFSDQIDLVALDDDRTTYRYHHLVREVLRDNRSGAERLAPSEYSLLLGATFQAGDRTLRDEELQGYSQRVVDAVSQIGARLRT